MSFYYGIPTQVIFIDTYNERHGGIAFHDFIICACCGGIFYGEDVISITDLAWISLEDELIGD